MEDSPAGNNEPADQDQDSTPQGEQPPEEAFETSSWDDDMAYWRAKDLAYAAELREWAASLEGSGTRTYRAYVGGEWVPMTRAEIDEWRAEEAESAARMREWADSLERGNQTIWGTGR